MFLNLWTFYRWRRWASWHRRALRPPPPHTGYSEKKLRNAHMCVKIIERLFLFFLLNSILILSSKKMLSTYFWNNENPINHLSNSVFRPNTFLNIIKNINDMVIWNTQKFFFFPLFLNFAGKIWFQPANILRSSPSLVKVHNIGGLLVVMPGHKY